MFTTEKIFISYRREDSPDVTGRIYDRLVKSFGHHAIFKDVDNIPFGVDFRTHLDQEVSQCRILLAVIGRDWVDAKDGNGARRLDNPGDFVRIEIESALKRNIPVIPLLGRNAPMPTENQLPESLADLVYRNGTQIRRDPDFHTDMDRLIKNIETHHMKKEVTSSQIATPQQPPQPTDPFADLPSRYKTLKDHLANGRWKEADRETLQVMLKVANRESEGYLDVDSIDNFPCEDLRIIDQLWVSYSGGKFGFSVQKKIHQKLGGTREYNREVWNAFGDRVGWREKGEWLYYYHLTFTNERDQGATSPNFSPQISSLAYRLVNCNL